MKYIFFILFFCASVQVLAQAGNAEVAKGNAAFNERNYSTALDYYNKALEKNNKHGQAYYNKGNVLYQQKKFAEAAENYAAAQEHLNTNASKATAAYNEGVAEAKQKRWQQAVNAFKQSLKLNPTDNDARENLQLALNELKKQQPPPPQQQPKENKKDPQKNAPKPEEPKLNKKQIEKELDKLRNQEKELQKQLQRKQSSFGGYDKDW